MGRITSPNAASYKQELDEMFAQDERVQVIFEDFPFAKNSPAAAVAVIKTWLQARPARHSPVNQGGPIKTEQ